MTVTDIRPFEEPPDRARRADRPGRASLAGGQATLETAG